MRVLVIVDMQNDFIDGALGTAEARAILPALQKKLEEYRRAGDTVLFTRDTHTAEYLSTQEGKNLPVSHCIRGTEGWQIHPSLDTANCRIFDKPAFGSVELGRYIASLPRLEQVELAGVCTDICVISNAMLVKNRFPELQVIVDAACCAGVMPETHMTALRAMDMCQIEILHGHAGEAEE